MTPPVECAWPFLLQSELARQWYEIGFVANCANACEHAPNVCRVGGTSLAWTRCLWTTPGDNWGQVLIECCQSDWLERVTSPPPHPITHEVHCDSRHTSGRICPHAGENSASSAASHSVVPSATRGCAVALQVFPELFLLRPRRHHSTRPLARGLVDRPPAKSVSAIWSLGLRPRSRHRQPLRPAHPSTSRERRMTDVRPHF